MSMDIVERLREPHAWQALSVKGDVSFWKNTNVPKEAAERIAFLEQELAERDESPYCTICESCGEEGCGCTHKCKFAFSHPEVEAFISELEAEIERLREVLKEARDFVKHTIGSSYCETDEEDEDFLTRLNEALEGRSDG